VSNYGFYLNSLTEIDINLQGKPVLNKNGFGSPKTIVVKGDILV